MDEDQVIKQTSVKGICMNCEDPCYTCDGDVKRCTSCLRFPINYLIHLKGTPGARCVQYCPPKYIPNEDNSECIYEGLICDEGYEPDRTDTRCIPVYFECAEGYELNEELTACVPEPGSPIPFPFLIATIFVSFLVLGSYLKEKFFTKVSTCLIAIIGSFEVPMQALMVIYAVIDEEWVIAGVCAIGLLSLVLANLAFTVYFQRDVVGKDITLSKWLYFFPKTKKIVPVASALLNFKCSKFLYSGFYGLESSMAKFSRPMDFYRVLRLCSFFSFIFSYGFIFVADFMILTQIKWGG